MTIRVGTRGSALALAQARPVADALAAATGRQVTLVEITTAGDRSTAPVPQLGVGVFVSALRDALAAREVDLAVHSYKDLPTATPDGLRVAAVPEREDPRDALVARDGLTLAALPRGARIGTGAPRRVAQLRALHRGLSPVPVRGNVDTRLRRVADGDLDAVLVARAGLARLGRVAEITETVDPGQVLPAPAQGALAVECRTGEPELAEAIATLDHPPTRAAVVAERELLSTLEAGCSAPVAALAGPAEGGGLVLHGAVVSLDGQLAIRLRRRAGNADTDAAAAARLGRNLAAELLAAGAGSVMEATVMGSRGTGATTSGAATLGAENR